MENIPNPDQKINPAASAQALSRMQFLREVASFRVAADRNGYGVMELRTGDKACKVANWPNGAAKPHNIASLRAGFLNTGILCAGLRVVDIDADDPVIVSKIEKLVRCMLADAPSRSRSNSPRKAFVFRATDGQPRKRAVESRSLVNLDGKASKVEVLGSGQFVLAHGVHPSGAPLVWPNGSPADTPLAALPAVSETQIDALLKAVAKLIDAEAPQTTHRASSSNAHAPDPLSISSDTVSGGPVSIRRLEAMLDQIGAHPSRPFHDYDTWVRQLCLPVAGMIRRGQVERDQAVALIHRLSKRHG